MILSVVVPSAVNVLGAESMKNNAAFRESETFRHDTGAKVRVAKIDR